MDVSFSMQQDFPGGAFTFQGPCLLFTWFSHWWADRLLIADMPPQERQHHIDYHLHGSHFTWWYPYKNIDRTKVRKAIGIGRGP